MRPAVWICCLATTMICALPAMSEDWPRFRGPNYNGVSIESGWTTEWPESGPDVAWKANVGIGVSSFAVVGDRVVTMGSPEGQDREVVSCYAASSGQVLWQFGYACKFDPRQFEGGPAATPTIDDGLVFTLGYRGHLNCLNLANGHVVWSKHLVRDFGGRYSSWKYAGSPLIVGDLLILDSGAEGTSTLALNKANGSQVWGVGRDLAGYSTPVPFEQENRRGVLVFKARAMVAHDLASGQELWRIPWKTYYDCNASCPTVVGDKLFISTGYGGRSARGAAFQLGRGQPEQLWLNDDIETKMNSAVIYEGHVYCISEKSRGQLMCCNLRDGVVDWIEPSFEKYGTLMIANGKLVILDEDGELVIAGASPEGYREFARAQVLRGRCWVMPVLANGRIYAKTNLGEMVCLDVRGKATVSLGFRRQSRTRITRKPR